MRQPLSSPLPRAVAVVERDGKVLVIRRHLDGRDYAVLPGGGIEEGESPAEAVVRELAEECSLRGEVAELLTERDDGGRPAWYFRVVCAEGEPVLGGEEAAGQDDADQHHPMWAGPQDLALLGLLPEGLADLVDGWLWPVRVRQATDDDRAAIANLWQLYQHDLSEFRGMTPGPDGRLAPGRLDSFRPDDPDVAAHLALRGDRPVGFALVRGLSRDARTLGEFFVVRAVRGRGLARDFAARVLVAHPGRWWIAFQEENPRAARFWRRLAGDVLTGVREEAREVPGKPYLPPDIWLTGSTR